MKLILLTPFGTIAQSQITKVSMETLDGYRTLLPKHIDFVAALKTNIVVYTETDGAEKYAACHRGVAVKKGDIVTITSQNILLGNTLEELEKIIATDFKQNEEKRKELNTAMARLELGVIRGFTLLSKENING